MKRSEIGNATRHIASPQSFCLPNSNRQNLHDTIRLPPCTPDKCVFRHHHEHVSAGKTRHPCICLQKALHSPRALPRCKSCPTPGRPRRQRS